MKKLSDRAVEVLTAILTRCPPTNGVQNYDGAGGFWVPNSDTARSVGDWSDELGRFVNVSGAGDVRILRSLEEAGFIKRPKTELPNKHVYFVTESGAVAIEAARENGTLDRLKSRRIGGDRRDDS